MKLTSSAVVAGPDQTRIWWILAIKNLVWLYTLIVCQYLEWHSVDAILYHPQKPSSPLTDTSHLYIPKKFLCLSLYADPHQKLMGSFLDQDLPSIQVLWKSVQYVLCNLADKPTIPTNGHRWKYNLLDGIDNEKSHYVNFGDQVRW